MPNELDLLRYHFILPNINLVGKQMLSMSAKQLDPPAIFAWMVFHKSAHCSFRLSTLPVPVFGRSSMNSICKIG